jgi:hypothetical protein
MGVQRRADAAASCRVDMSAERGAGSWLPAIAATSERKSE